MKPIMSSYKNQHFVPRCYFRPFSLNRKGKAVNLYNINSSQTIRNASVKGQCSKDYLYGDSLEIEHLLENLERDYARVLWVLDDQSGNPTEQDLNVLREFMILQYCRTEAAAKKIGSWFQCTYETTSECSSLSPPDLDLSTRTMALEALQMHPGFLDITTDLKICIVRNEALSDFVTSDDPVFLTSRFHAQKLRNNVFGAGSAGALFFLPISPRLLLVLYDADIYTVIAKQGSFISINSERDVYACNELQYLNADGNIYFSDWNQRGQIERQFKAVAMRGQDNRVRSSKLVEDGQIPGGRFYRQAKDDEDTIDCGALIRMTNLRVFPTTWISKLRFRKNRKIRYVNDGSLPGCVRRYVYQNRHRF